MSTPWRVAAAVSDNPARSRIRRSSVPSRRLRSVGGFLALTPALRCVTPAARHPGWGTGTCSPRTKAGSTCAAR
ncbi:hypothetical protein, partial [Streptomyces sp. NPDC047968]|uniref:hypothetical protein n=1 Tax=Streptomyces sp. NPDC047968 TaxID=3155382 RepID=UPI00343BB192